LESIAMMRSLSIRIKDQSVPAVSMFRGSKIPVFLEVSPF
jgi:hypothetical protein